MTAVKIRDGILLLLVLLLTSLSSLAQYTPTWHPIDLKKQIVVGQDGDFEMFIFVVDDFTLLGVASTPPHADKLILVTDEAASTHVLTDATDSVALYALEPHALNALMGSQHFRLIIKGLETDVITGDLASVYELVTTGAATSDLNAQLDNAVCMLSHSYRRRAVQNRLAGMSRSESLEAIAASNQQDQTSEQPDDAKDLSHGLLVRANTNVYQISDSVFNDEQKRGNVIAMIHQQCLQGGGDEVTPEQLNSQERAQSIIAESFKLLFKGQDIPEDILTTLTQTLSQCLLDKFAEQSPEAAQVYVQEINRTGSLLEARDRSVMRMQQEQITFSSDSFSTSYKACVEALQSP